MKKTAVRLLAFFLMLHCLLFPGMQTEAEGKGAEEKAEGRAISIALDVSGSMKENDEKRLSFELIKMFIDSCSEKDYIGVTAYNDTIVYTSGMTSMKEASVREELKLALDEIAFSGETDNGLGLYTATKTLADAGLDVEKSFVLMVTDGNTDLEASTTERTVEDSNADMELSSQLAREHDISLHIIEYTGEYMQDTSLLSVAAAQTGGGTMIVEEPVSFIRVMISTFFSQYNAGSAALEDGSYEELVNRTEFTFPDQQETIYHAIIFSTEPIRDMEVVGGNETIPYAVGTHYMVFDTREVKPEKVTAIYSIQEPSVILTGTVAAAYEESVEADTEPVPEPEIMEAPEISDSETETEEPASEETASTLLVAAVIGIIVIATAVICFFIIKRLLFMKKRELPSIHGCLELTFIDIKSRHESMDVTWNLEEYPPEGVSLAELFKSRKIDEDLKDLDKICFYPSEVRNEIILVHCMEGGVFREEQLLKANVPVKLKAGDVIFLSFAENASEISLKYDIAGL